MNLDGSDRKTLRTFLGGTSDGAYPGGDLVLVGSTLFGTTERGGAFSSGGVDGGTIFSIELDGSGYKIWHHFSRDDGWNPRGGLTRVGDTLYGINHSFTTSRDFLFALQIPEPTGLVWLAVAGGLLRWRRGRVER
jgi:hypothetical protein